MDKLHDTYQRLLKAGMPDAGLHYTLFAQTTAGFNADCPEGGFWSAMQNEATRLRLHGMRDEHAHAIIEQAARDFARNKGWLVTDYSTGLVSVNTGDATFDYDNLCDAVLAALKGTNDAE